jgi:hypothetical protein
MRSGVEIVTEGQVQATALEDGLAGSRCGSAEKFANGSRNAGSSKKKAKTSD